MLDYYIQTIESRITAYLWEGKLPSYAAHTQNQQAVVVQKLSFHY